MTQLFEIQDNFQNYLLNNNQTFAKDIINDARVGRDQRMQVYFSSYRLRLFEVLMIDFPKTYALMGDDLFEQACELYLKNHPSKHFSIRYFGAQFSDFLAQNKPFNADLVFAEMALFEWLIGETIDAANAKNHEVFSLAEFMKTTPEVLFAMKFKFHPSLRIVDLYFDTPQLWLNIEEKQQPRAAQYSEKPTMWMLWRKELLTLFESCSHEERLIYNAIISEANFVEICEICSETLDADLVANLVSGTLNKWIKQEILIQYT